MLFNSFIFVLIFLPLCLGGWFGLHKLNRVRMARGLMIAASLCFYAFFSWKFVLILLSCAFLTYGAAALADTRSDKRVLMAAGILLNLLPLCF